MRMSKRIKIRIRITLRIRIKIRIRITLRIQIKTMIRIRITITITITRIRIKIRIRIRKSRDSLLRTNPENTQRHGDTRVWERTERENSQESCEMGANNNTPQYSIIRRPEYILVYQ